MLPHVARQFVKSLRDSSLRNGGTLVSEESIEADGAPAIDYTIKLPEGRYVRFLVVARGRHFYTTSVTGSSLGRVSDEDADRFVNSIRFDN